MNRRAIIAGALAAPLVGAATATAATAASKWVTRAVPGKNILVSGCVVRFDTPDGSPRLHANAAHVTAGVTDVSITSSGRLRLVQSVHNPTRNPILFATAQADETLVKRGISIGASGGTDDTSYLFAQNGRKLDLNDPDDLMKLQGRYSNAWFGWIHAPGWWQR